MPVQADRGEPLVSAWGGAPPPLARPVTGIKIKLKKEKKDKEKKKKDKKVAPPTTALYVPGVALLDCRHRLIAKPVASLCHVCTQGLHARMFVEVWQRDAFGDRTYGRSETVANADTCSRCAQRKHGETASGGTQG